MTISRFDAQARLGDDFICGDCWISKDEPFGCACESLLAGQAAPEETIRDGGRQDDGSRGAGDGAADLAERDRVLMDRVCECAGCGCGPQGEVA